MRIGSLEIERPLILAPMEDVSDYPFRLICKEFGADILYSEFANCEGIVRDIESTLRRIRVTDAERPMAVQIYGSNPDSMREAAGVAEQAGPDFVDINAGCWVKKIATRGDGAGLLRDLKKFEAVVRAAVAGTRLPVTVKTRLGWDENSICILEVARMLEQCGVRALAVHARTRTQAYRGQADWTWFEKIKQILSIPLIGNGDIKTPEDAQTVFSLGCDGVMIGRAAMHDPWIFQQTRHYLDTGEHLPEPDLRNRIALCLRHLRAAAEYKGERRAVLEHRKRYAGYLRNAPNIARLRARLMVFTEIAPIADELERYIEEDQE